MMHCLQDMKLFRACALLPAALLLGAAARTEPALPPRVVDSYGKLPLSLSLIHIYGHFVPGTSF